jgi:hypothetical protein
MIYVKNKELKRALLESKEKEGPSLYFLHELSKITKRITPKNVFFIFNIFSNLALF